MSNLPTCIAARRFATQHTAPQRNSTFHLSIVSMPRNATQRLFWQFSGASHRNSAHRDAPQRNSTQGFL
jgi:hypothetical protein